MIESALDPQPTREFPDEDGERWVATVYKREGKDFKGRYCFYVYLADGDVEDGYALVDVRWNSPKTATRTLQTMSEVELRRRLRSARDRAQTPTGAASSHTAE